MRALGASRTSLAPGGVLAGPWVKNELWRRARAVPTLDLRFAENKSLTDAVTGQSLVTFTRASKGTYVDSEGVIRTAVTNLLLQSEDFSTTWNLTGATVTTNSVAAPTGATTAGKLIESAGGTTHFTAQTFTIAAATVYTLSAFVKAAERSRVALYFGGAGGAAQGIIVNLATGTFAANIVAAPTSYSIVPFSNGWYRISITATSIGTAANFAIYICDNTNAFSYSGDGTSGIYIWGAQLEESSTVGEYIPTTSTINSAPRFDHNPTTGESLGLLVEESRTNGIRNNTMVGAVAGTPGTLPTNWSVAAGGLTQEIIGTGVESGISYIDIKFSGTSTADGNLFYELNTQIAALQNQAWTISHYVKIIGGALPNANAVRSRIIERNSVGGYLAETNLAFTPASSSTLLSASRESGTRTLNNASTAFVQPGFLFAWGTGTTVDITLRIGLPQLEQGAFSTSVIPTSTAAVTRAADVASIGGTAFSSWYRQDEGTVFADSSRTSIVPASDFPQVFHFNNGTEAETINIGYITSAGSQFRIRSSNSNSVNIIPTNSGLRRVTAGAYSAASAAVSEFGQAAIEDTSVTLPTGLDRVAIGNSAGNNYTNGTIRRLCCWGQRLPNSTLQTITQ